MSNVGKKGLKTWENSKKDLKEIRKQKKLNHQSMPMNQKHSPTPQKSFKREKNKYCNETLQKRKEETGDWSQRQLVRQDIPKTRESMKGGLQREKARMTAAGKILWGQGQETRRKRPNGA